MIGDMKNTTTAAITMPPVLLSRLRRMDTRWVMGALRRLMVGRTTLIIAHRLSTVRHANRITVLESGRVVEVGTHAQLMIRRGRYYALQGGQEPRALDNVA